MTISDSIRTRFWAKVHKSCNCWLWTYNKTQRDTDASDTEGVLVLLIVSHGKSRMAQYRKGLGITVFVFCTNATDLPASTHRIFSWGLTQTTYATCTARDVSIYMAVTSPKANGMETR